MIPITGLYETHLTVSNLDRSIDFYRDIVGLEFAHRIPSRNVAFFWVGGRERSMLGLWSIHSSPVQLKLHIAFQTTLDQLLLAPDYLRSKGVVPRRGGSNEEINEPVVFPWMPAASVYFDDPDGHSLEFITVLPESPRLEISGTVPFAEWQRMKNNKEV
ncbi:catechol 2,3-dioxygenase-like lactoylglutathione lyase family enzyme [Agrobacterium vitis]|nr:catechol 2,3-dioxygenase-like lactoylglutathione lyase family enzyme [Agrobacterium vitis]MBE1437525.1 catechol 2,3-dioxygenase-like lactoylglutathione lyase family enzyme [Agrobacterium vitis]